MDPDKMNLSSCVLDVLFIVINTVNGAEYYR